LQSPSNAATVSANPIFTWGTVANATQYQIQVSTVNNFSSTVVDAVTANTNYTPIAKLPNTPRFCRVKSFNAANEPAASSNSFSFTKSQSLAPTVTAPANAATLTFPSQPVTLAWDPLPGMKSYDIEIALEPLFTQPVVLQASTQQVTYTVDT